MKFGPQSERKIFTGPRTEYKHRIQEELFSCSTTSMCASRVVRHVKRMYQRLFLAWPSLLRRVTIDQGPNVSTPTFVNGGPGSRRSLGRSAIIGLLIFVQL